ncbi:hypothetical protein BC832DRAFT_220695 [Gaertneriomyces semiglobifer]|nr:hypothetical protein BC832DRAFT_220695 [Gaertneriomyces semiglobifer]
MIDGAQRLFDVYKNDGSQGNPDDVFDSLQAMSSDLSMLECVRSRLHAQINVIINGIGEPPEARLHSFEPKAYALPTSCDYCHDKIWGVARSGISCTVCGFNAHLRCEDKIAPECSGRRGERPTITPRSTQLTLRMPPGSSADPISAPNTASSTVVPEVSRAIPLAGGTIANVLYGYHPSGSPATLGQIAVAPGDVVRVVEPDDGSGWTLVALESDGAESNTGLVPSSYIMPATHAVAAENERSAYMGSRSRRPSPVKLPGIPVAHSRSRSPSPAKKRKEIQMIVAFDYTSTNDDELTIQAGQKVRVVSEDDGSGWTMVAGESGQGLVPTSYLT